MFLTDAELLLGLSRHLKVYQQGPERAALEQLEMAGQVLDFAFRLRGSTSSPAERVAAIGLEIGLGRVGRREVITTMETLGWVSVSRDASGQPISVAESIPPPADLVQTAPRLLDILLATPAERAALAVLRATTLQPLLVEDALDVAAHAEDADGSGEIAGNGMRHLVHTGLVRRIRTEDGRDVAYNPNVWVQGDEIAKAALRAADAKATGEVTALLEELGANPGMPAAHVTSTEKKWVDFAVSQGLVQRSVIQTSDGMEQGFLFTPHLSRDPFGGTAGDASGQVRQLVGSMIYAATFAAYRLRNPAAFLNRLIQDGEAGNVSSIGTDYPMLEKAGIVRVKPGFAHGRFRLELLQSDVAESALELLDVRASRGGGEDAAALQAQRSYVHTDQERARLALTAETDEVEQARLIAALRDESMRRPLGGAG
jgi:hypothetical protein